jgi:hypothetical protein
VEVHMYPAAALSADRPVKYIWFGLRRVKSQGSLSTTLKCHQLKTAELAIIVFPPIVAGSKIFLTKP